MAAEKSFIVEADIAQKLLEEFVSYFGAIYGEELISFNIHGLLHLSDCVKQYGPINNFSAYEFENYMQYLKKLINKPNKILQQLYLRLRERQGQNLHSRVTLESFYIDDKKEKNSFFVCRNIGPIKVIKVVSDSEPNKFICKSFHMIENFFVLPLESYSGLGILFACQLSDETIKITKQDIEYKYFGIPY